MNKYLPYILAAVALISLYLNYEQWRLAKHDCKCQENEFSPIK